MDIAKRGIIRFVAKICGTWKRTNLHPLQGFSWLEPQLTASKFAGVGCPQLTHIYSKYRNMICPQQLQQPQLQVSALFLHFWNKKMHYNYALCSRNFQNVKLRKHAWCGNLTICLPLRFYVKSNIGEFRRSKDAIFGTIGGCEFCC